MLYINAIDVLEILARKMSQLEAKEKYINVFGVHNQLIHKNTNGGKSIRKFSLNSEGYVVLTLNDYHWV